MFPSNDSKNEKLNKVYMVNIKNFFNLTNNLHFSKRKRPIILWVVVHYDALASFFSILGFSFPSTVFFVIETFLISL